MVAPFPLLKLAMIAFKQVSKPLANSLKTRAKSSYFFRTYICMPPAQMHHWVEVNIKMRMMNLGKPTEVTPLNENMAIELGAELLGETIIFTVAATCLMAEWYRGYRKELGKEAAREARMVDLEERLHELEFVLSEHQAQMKELQRGFFGSKLQIFKKDDEKPEIVKRKQDAVKPKPTPDDFQIPPPPAVPVEGGPLSPVQMAKCEERKVDKCENRDRVKVSFGELEQRRYEYGAFTSAINQLRDHFGR